MSRVDQALEIARLKGEILLLEAKLVSEVNRAYDEMDVWRVRYLKEHPELDTWNSVEDIQ